MQISFLASAHGAAARTRGNARTSIMHSSVGKFIILTDQSAEIPRRTLTDNNLKNICFFFFYKKKF